MTIVPTVDLEASRNADWQYDALLVVTPLAGAITGTPVPWAASTAYAAGAFVYNAGTLYTANGAITTGTTFDATQFTVFCQLFNLSGADLRMDIKAGGVTAQLNLRIGSGITVVDAANGWIRLNLSAAQLYGLQPQTYLHDLVAVRAGTRTLMWTGQFVLDAGVTYD